MLSRSSSPPRPGHVYGYPLVYDLGEVDRESGCRVGMGSLAPAPMNTFSPRRPAAGPEAKFVCGTTPPSLDAHLDLRRARSCSTLPTRRALLRTRVHRRLDEQLRLRRPPVHRHRRGPLPVDPTRPRGRRPQGRGRDRPDRDLHVIGRTPGHRPRRPAAGARPSGPLHAQLPDHVDPLPPAGRSRPPRDPGVGAELACWDQLRVALAAFPPPAGDAGFLGRPAVRAHGDRVPVRRPDPGWPRPWGTAEGRSRGSRRSASGRRRDGQRMDLRPHVSTTTSTTRARDDDSAAWKIPDRHPPTCQSVAARVGLWGNHGYEARYACCGGYRADGSPGRGQQR